MDFRVSLKQILIFLIHSINLVFALVLFFLTTTLLSCKHTEESCDGLYLSVKLSLTTPHPLINPLRPKVVVFFSPSKIINK